MTPLQMLKSGRAMLAHPAAWCQGTMRDRDTGARCSIGALEDIETGGFRKEGLMAMEYLLAAADVERPPLCNVPFMTALLNDHHDHAWVLAWWDRAIELAELDETISVEELIEVLSPV